MAGIAKQLQVLVVDDSRAMIMLLKRILEDHGYRVIGEAQSGEEAVEQYEKLQPDLVTMDLILPGISGVEATKKIMEKNPHAVIVAVSSVAGAPEKLLEALRAGAKNVISKPFDPEKIAKILGDVFNS